MAHERSHRNSVLEDESMLLWSFLEEETEACAVVSSRMEFVYLNQPARQLVPKEWFAKRCFETFPVANEKCAFFCPTISAVHAATEIVYCKESLRLGQDGTLELDVAVIPIEGKPVDEARSLLVFREHRDEASLRTLATEAAVLRDKLRSRSDQEMAEPERHRH